MVNIMAGYMDNLANATGVNSGTFTAVNERLAEITATLKSLAELNSLFAATIAEKSKELHSLIQQLNKTKNSCGGDGGGGGFPLESRVASWVREKYCHTHGYGVGKNHTSSTCFMTGDGSEHAATRMITIGGSVLNKGWDVG